MARRGSERHVHIDALKAVASQLIVLHHLAFYGPMSDHAEQLAPSLFDWLHDHARAVVQIFLVLGGYLCVQRLAPQGRLLPGLSLPVLLVQRYLRLVLPYAVMLLLAVAATALARRWMVHDSLSAPATLGQVLVHLLLLQDLLGVEALSAGVWYVAIDLQLFGLLLLLLAGSAVLEHCWRPERPLAPLLVLAGVALSLLGFNRDPGWDALAPYFFGAYGLGVLAAWRRAGVPGAGPVWWAGLGVLLLALDLEWRDRIALAGGTALLLAHWRGPGASSTGRLVRGIEAAGRISYAVFLVHFPVCLLVNALFVHFLPPSAAVQLLGVLLAWLASSLAGALFHRHVEVPAMQLVQQMSRRVRPGAVAA